MFLVLWGWSLANVLAIVPELPAPVRGRTLLSDRFILDIFEASAESLAAARERAYDLLVVASSDVDFQQSIAANFQQTRRWRLVPVLYISEEGQTGFTVPGTFRPEMDGLTRGDLNSPAVVRRIQEMARDGVAAAELVVAGPYELDQLRGRLRFREWEVLLTEREAEILSILLTHSDRTVAASEIIERGWGAQPDERYLQILRRHVSNIRRKLANTTGSTSVRTIRGDGYQFDVRGA